MLLLLFPEKFLRYSKFVTRNGLLSGKRVGNKSMDLTSSTGMLLPAMSILIPIPSGYSIVSRKDSLAITGRELPLEIFSDSKRSSSGSIKKSSRVQATFVKLSG